MASNFSQECFAFDNETSKKMGIAWIAGSSFSIFISTTLLVILCAMRKWKTGNDHRLLLWFTITVVFQGPSCIMQAAAISYDTLTVNRPLCVAAGIYKQYSIWLVNLTILWIALYLFRVYKNSVFRSSKNIVFHSSSGGTRPRLRSRTIGAIILVVILVVPVPFALIPLLGHKYGVVVAWCWIVARNQSNCTEQDDWGIAYQYAFWVVPFLLVVIALNLLSITIFFIFLYGYKTNQYEFVQKEYFYRMQEFLPLLVSLFIYGLLCIVQVANFTTDLVDEPKFSMWIAYIVIGQVKEAVVMVGYLITLLVVAYKAKKRNKKMSLASTTKVKNYSAFECFTPNPKESSDSKSKDMEEAA